MIMNARESYHKATGKTGDVTDEYKTIDDYIEWLEAELEGMWLLYGNRHAEAPQGVIYATGCFPGNTVSIPPQTQPVVNEKTGKVVGEITFGDGNG